MSDTTEFAPRVVTEVPAPRVGPRGKALYDQVFDLAVQSQPDSILAAESVPAHRSVILREALAVRLDRPEHAGLKRRGKFVVQSRSIGKMPDGDGNKKRRVDIYVTFEPLTDEEIAALDAPAE